MKKSFNVAGHVFSLEMSADSQVWKSLSNYTPFTASDDKNAVFSLKVVDSLPDREKELLLDGTSDEIGEARIDMYSYGEFFLFEMAPVQSAPVCARLLTGRDYTEGVVTTANGYETYGINNAMMLMYAFRTISENTLEMHASVVVNDGKGYLFLGKSGTGKSTHSRLWLENVPGSELINDDNPIVRVCEDGIIRVFGSPWSGKTPCYRNVEAPIGAFVQIRQCKENRISRMKIVESYASIYSSCSGLKTDTEMADCLHETLQSVVSSVPCYLLDCLPDAAAAELSSQTVKK